MKTLTCKMCGSTQLIEENGMYLCQSCGTKYSASELDDSNKTDETPSPEMLKKEAETQEEIKRLRALVKDDYSLWSRILELDWNDWEAYYYTNWKFIYTSIIDWEYLSKTFDRLKERVSSDKKLKTCIKDVVYKDLKEWADSKLRHYIVEYKKKYLSKSVRYFDERDKEKEKEYLSDVESSIVFYSKKMEQLKNRIISIFGENFSDFADELKNDFDKLIEQRRSDTYVIKEEREKHIRKLEEEKRKLKEKLENRHRIGVILIIIGIIVTFCSVRVLFSTENFEAVIGILIGLSIAGAGVYNRWFEDLGIH